MWLNDSQFPVMLLLTLLSASWTVSVGFSVASLNVWPPRIVSHSPGRVRRLQVHGPAVSSSKSFPYNSSGRIRVDPALKDRFEKNGSVLYRQSVLTQEELAAIASDLSSLRLAEETTSSVARHRVGAIVPQTSDTFRILQRGSVQSLIQAIAGPEHQLSTIVPVEVRVYETRGSGMEWHVDDVLYDPPQLEVVLTIENTSDCTTMWKNIRESASFTESVETSVNSVIVLRAGEAPHCVSSLKRGRRVIVKCVYVHAEATFHSSAMVPQFAESKGKRRSRKR